MSHLSDRLRQLYARALWRNVTVRAAIGTTGANAAILGVNMLTGVITARILAPAGRGELAAMTMWPQFLGFALAFGLPTALVYHMQREEHPRPVLLSAALACIALAGMLGTALGIVFVPFALRAYDPDAVQAAQWFMLLTPFGVMLNLLSAAFLREGSFALYNGLRLAAPCVTLITLAVLALIGALTPASASAAYLLPTLPLMLITFVLAKRSIGIASRVERGAAKSLLRFGLAYYGAELTGAISSQLDRILVVWMLTPAAMGLYVVALSFSRLFQQVPISIASVILPKVSQVAKEEVIRLTAKAAWVSATMSVLMAAPAVIFAVPILVFFFGEDFKEAAGAFSILTIEAVIGGVAVILNQAFLGLGKPGATSFYSLVGLLAIIPLLLLLGIPFGLLGAAAATAGSTIIRIVFMLIGLRKLSKQVERTT